MRMQIIVCGEDYRTPVVNMNEEEFEKHCEGLGNLLAKSSYCNFTLESGDSLIAPREAYANMHIIVEK